MSNTRKYRENSKEMQISTHKIDTMLVRSFIDMTTRFNVLILFTELSFSLRELSV